MGCGGSKGVEPVPVAPMEGSKPQTKAPVAVSPPAKPEPAAPQAPESPPPAHVRPHHHVKGHTAGDVDKEAKLRKLQEQEDASIEQQMAAKYKAYEEEQRKKALLPGAAAEQAQSSGAGGSPSGDAGGAKSCGGGHAGGARRKKKEEQEDDSIERQTAAQYKAYEAAQLNSQPGGGDSGGERRKKLEEQEDLSIEQKTAAQYKAYEAEQLRKHAETSEEAARAKALHEADDMLDMFAPPKLADHSPEKMKVRARSVRHVNVPLEEMVFAPDSGEQEDRNAISCIVESRIYLTNFRGAERADELQALGVKHIVCVNEQSNDHPEKFAYFNIDTLEDQEDHDATPHFAAVKAFTDEALAKGGGVCFHCAAGISRSTTMVVSYLMGSKRMTLKEAFAQTYTRRKVAWPNRTFMKQLIAYEKTLQDQGWLDGETNTITLGEWDEWTMGNLEEREAQHRVSLSDRTITLRGKDSDQFAEYVRSMSQRDALH